VQRMLVAVLVAALGACTSAADGAPTTTTAPSSTEADTSSSSTEVDTSSTERVTGVEPPARVRCGTQFRPIAGSAAGEVEDTITVERPDSETGRSEAETLSFADFEISVVYADDGYETPSVVVTISSADEAVERVLYQFTSNRPRFGGSADSADLHYVYSGEAELQWWCTAPG
jgi:hypothetical protein